MMTPDRRAKIIELARAVAELNEVALNVCKCRDCEAEREENAERLDKAMVAWFMDRFVNAQIQVCTGGGYVDPKIESTPTAARPQE
jgi:hypothetical protein